MVGRAPTTPGALDATTSKSYTSFNRGRCKSCTSLIEARRFRIRRFRLAKAFTADAADLRKLDLQGLPPEAFLGVAGMPGLTAYAVS